MDTSPEERRVRARGCLLAAACGDGMGAPFEVRGRSVDEDAVAAWLESAEALRVTDDTVMMETLARHLTDTVGRGHEMNQDALMDGFLKSWRDDPHRGYGAGTRRLLGQVDQGMLWREARSSTFGGQGSYGNGAAMRVAPAGLLPWPLSEIVALAHRTAEVTHTHRLGSQGAVAQAVAVALALASDPATRLDRDEFLNRVGAQVNAHAYLAQLERLRFLPATATPGEAAQRIGNNSTAMAAVPAALAAFLRHPDDPAATIRFAVLIGGDTDTIATMAGALAGARCGEGALPSAWLARLADTERLRALADVLAAAPARSAGGR